LQKNQYNAILQSQQVIDTLRPECVSEFRGKLNFSVTYEKEISTLYVHLLEAVDLPIKDITGMKFGSVRACFLNGATGHDGAHKSTFLRLNIGIWFIDSTPQDEETFKIPLQYFS
ncbi:hypothetical protein COOONC_08735, partial [Cooperia oncophora]